MKGKSGTRPSQISPRSSGTKGKYRSKFERDLASSLKKKGFKFKYESKAFNYLVQGRNIIVCPNCGPLKAQIVRKYTPDFDLYECDFFIEGKGQFIAKDRSKMIAVKKQHPLLDVRLVFMRDNVIKEGKDKLRYSEWATKYGYKWAVKDIPDSWLVKRDFRRKINYRQALGDC